MGWWKSRDKSVLLLVVNDTDRREIDAWAMMLFDCLLDPASGALVAVGRE